MEELLFRGRAYESLVICALLLLSECIILVLPKLDLETFSTVAFKQHVPFLGCLMLILLSSCVFVSLGSSCVLFLDGRSVGIFHSRSHFSESLGLD